MDQKGTMMHRIILAAVSACLLVGGLPHAQAQPQQRQGFTPQELDRMSQQRMQEMGRVDHGPPPAQSSLPKLQLFQPAEPWVCKGTAAWQPIYASPSRSAPEVGKTLPAIAVGGRNVNGFSRVLANGGQIGYVPSETIHEYRSDVKPGSTCSVAGVRANGAPVFSYH
jgi:hypothetical protein